MASKQRYGVLGGSRVRSGVVRCVVAGDRVKLAGQARTVIAGAVNR